MGASGGGETEEGGGESGEMERPGGANSREKTVSGEACPTARREKTDRSHERATPTRG